jgi:hypothetical protein
MVLPAGKAAMAAWMVLKGQPLAQTSQARQAPPSQYWPVGHGCSAEQAVQILSTQTGVGFSQMGSPQVPLLWHVRQAGQLVASQAHAPSA